MVFLTLYAAKEPRVASGEAFGALGLRIKIADLKGGYRLSAKDGRCRGGLG
jgi:hypothetical protein